MQALQIHAGPRAREHLRRHGLRPADVRVIPAAAFSANAASRQALGGWMERVVFSDRRDALPLPLSDYPTRRAVLDVGNLAPALLASCTIPFVLQAVQDVPGGPPGTYWDGGITDYHLHLDYAAMTDAPAAGWPGGAGLVLYPHFSSHVVPGWLDKAWKRRHRATRALDNVVLLSPRPDWMRSLPAGKLPDRCDFKRYGDDHAARQREWRCALAESQRLADEFAELAASNRPVDVLPLL